MLKIDLSDEDSSRNIQHLTRSLGVCWAVLGFHCWQNMHSVAKESVWIVLILFHVLNTVVILIDVASDNSDTVLAVFLLIACVVCYNLKERTSKSS